MLLRSPVSAGALALLAIGPALLSAMLLLPTAGANDAPEPAYVPPPELGEAPTYPTSPIPVPAIAERAVRSATFPSTGGFGITSLADRALSRAFYKAVFLASEGTPINWTGSIAGCVPGDTDLEFKEAVLIRINWFRAMAGVPDSVVLNTGVGSYSAKDQAAAIIFSANNALSHSPDAGWTCYSVDGASGAANSNISLGNNGWNAVLGQIRDNGSGNAAAGHRRWLLLPQTQTMGTGDVPASGGGSYNSANGVWVFDGHSGDPRPAVRDGYVAYPPPGYVPYPAAFARWSFAYPGANFSAATVTMTKNGATPVTVFKEAYSGNSYGENTVVWVPTSEGVNSTSTTYWPKPSSDTTYTVTVSGITGAPQTSYTYDVTIFDPDVAGVGETIPTISGPTAIGTGGASYTHTTLGFGDGYELRELGLGPYLGDEDAEDGGVNIIDGTAASYGLISTATYTSPTHSFHLAHPLIAPQTEYFEVNRSFLLSATSQLRFQSRLRYATTDQIAKAQISLDGGTSWSDVYTQAGSGGSGEGSFSLRTVDLSAYDGRIVRFRFAYVFNSGSLYANTGATYGLYVDDIQVTNADEMSGSEVITSIGNTGSFTYTPSGPGTFALQVRAVPWTGFNGLEWGESYPVTVTAQNCNGGVVTVDWSFDAGVTETCTATTSLTTSGTVNIAATASVQFISPLVHLMPGFHAVSGAYFRAAQ